MMLIDFNATTDISDLFVLSDDDWNDDILIQLTGLWTMTMWWVVM